MDLMAVVLLVPVVTLKEATSSWVLVFRTRIYADNAQHSLGVFMFPNIYFNKFFGANQENGQERGFSTS